MFLCGLFFFFFLFSSYDHMLMSLHTSRVFFSLCSPTLIPLIIPHDRRTFSSFSFFSLTLLGGARNENTRGILTCAGRFVDDNVLFFFCFLPKNLGGLALIPFFERLLFFLLFFVRFFCFFFFGQDIFCCSLLSNSHAKPFCFPKTFPSANHDFRYACV